MDDRTEQLRDLFVETTGEEEVTESQAEDRGDLADEVAAEDAERRIRELIDQMRERYTFDSGLDADALVQVVTGFYADESDADLADTLETDTETVFLARTDLHLVRDADRDAPFPIEDLRELIVDDVPRDERAEHLQTDSETAEHYSRVVEADMRSTRANHRFTDAFAELLTDADLRESHAVEAHDSGMEEATDDMETNTQL